MLPYEDKHIAWIDIYLYTVFFFFLNPSKVVLQFEQDKQELDLTTERFLNIFHIGEHERISRFIYFYIFIIIVKNLSCQ